MGIDENLRLALDSVAKEGFRNVADYDYIGAKVSSRRIEKIKRELEDA